MFQFNKSKQRGLGVVWVIVTVSLVVGCKHAKAVAESLPSGESLVRVVKQLPEDTLAINLVCGKILRGDFEGAQETLRTSVFPYNKSLRQLRIIINEYMAIKASRKASQSNVYQAQIRKLESLRYKGLAQDVNDISKVFSIVLKISEYADKEQKQALLKDPLLIRTIQKAKTKAAEFKAKGKWLDAYIICYSKLMWIYQDNEAYSDYAE